MTIIQKFFPFDNNLLLLVENLKEIWNSFFVKTCDEQLICCKYLLHTILHGHRIFSRKTNSKFLSKYCDEQLICYCSYRCIKILRPEFIFHTKIDVIFCIRTIFTKFQTFLFSKLFFLLSMLWQFIYIVNRS